jgi:hypothetical protein
MVATASKTKNRAAGAAQDSSQSSSRARGASAADAAKPVTNLSELSAALDAFVPRERLNGNACPIKKMADKLPADVMQKVHAILDNERIVAKQVEEFFREWETITNIRVGIQSIWKHRRRDCACPKRAS